MNNINLLFNKSYFDGIGGSTFSDNLKRRTDEICRTVFSESDYIPIYTDVCTHRFFMKTTYPGMLVGTGYAHEAEQGKDECVKLGFSFDYVTGQPYIPGSSVKGMLRSVFANFEIMRELDPRLENAEVHRALVADIFDGKDAFFDAVVCRGDASGHLIGRDYITPHGKDMTKSPNPLLMIKILPEVIFEFRFRLSDFKLGDQTIGARKKMGLFIQLIELFGMGAKTNVGYGTLIQVNDDSVPPAVRNALALNRQGESGGTAQAETRCWGKNKTCRNLASKGEVLCVACANIAKITGKCAKCGRETGYDKKAKCRKTLCQSCENELNLWRFSH